MTREMCPAAPVQLTSLTATATSAVSLYGHYNYICTYRKKVGYMHVFTGIIYLPKLATIICHECKNEPFVCS